MLRECGHIEEAEQLRRTALADALAEIRAAEEPVAAIEHRLDATFAAEAERVANATVMAELLAPLLARQSASLNPFGAVAVPTETNPSAAPVNNLAPPSRASAPAAARSESADIAHFIDEMLTQERPAPHGSGVRRAS